MNCFLIFLIFFFGFDGFDTRQVPSQINDQTTIATSSLHEFGRVLNDLDPFQSFKKGHLKQREKRLSVHKGGPLSTDVHIARIMLQSCI